MRAYARHQPRRADCEPPARASTLRRVRRSERHGARQQLSVVETFDAYASGDLSLDAAAALLTPRRRPGVAAVVCLVVALLLATPAWAEGRKVDLQQGQPAPFSGALVDEAYARVLLERRRAAELAADGALLVADQERQRRQACEEACESRAPGAATATLVAVVVTAAALGLLGGVWLGARAAR